MKIPMTLKNIVLALASIAWQRTRCRIFVEKTNLQIFFLAEYA